MTVLTTIEDSCELVTDGTHFTPPNVGVGVPFLTVKDVTDSGLDFVNCSFIRNTDFLAAQDSNSAPRQGDVLFSKDGTVGKVHVVTTNQPFAVLSSLAILRPDKSKVDSSYLGHVLKFPRVLNDALKRKTGSAIRRIVLADLKRVHIPLPPLPDQRRIVAILDKADELRAKRRETLDQLNGLTQAMFLQMFGDPATNPRRFPMISLKDLFIFRTGKLDSNAAVANGKYPFFTCSRDDLRIDDYAFDCEALLLAGNNANADYSVKHYSGKFNAYQRTYVVTLRDASYSYDFARFALEYQLAEMKRRSKGTGTKYLTLDILNRMLIPVPPVEAQHEFSGRIAAVARVRVIHKSSMKLLKDLFSGLQSRAFAGEL